MKLRSLAIVSVLALAACNKMPAPQGGEYQIRLEPVMTRATDSAFENGDAIGLTISRATADYATNQKMIYNGLEFSSDLKWYAEASDESTLAAYYPYADAVPTSFSVQTDQSAGISSSDFIAAVKSGVLPTANAVTMPFKHKLVKLVINLSNEAGYTLDQLVLKGLIPTATIASDFSAVADTEVDPTDIIAYQSGENTFEIIVPAQTAIITLVLTASGNEMEQKLAEAALEAGMKYNVNVVVNEQSLDVLISGAIDDWGDGGEIPVDNGDEPGEVQFEETVNEEGVITGFTYDNVQYNVVKMKDGKYWMAQNLAYLPAGKTACTDLNNVTAGVYAPLKVNDGHTAAEFSTDADVIAANGYLYQAEFALGLKVGDLKSVADAQALEGAQGICPPGWHVPTLSDILGLVGKSVGADTNADAPYYDGANGSIAKLNADGFNMGAYGMVSIQDNTKTSGTLQGWNSNYPDRLTSSMVCGSTYGGVTYNTSGDATSGVKNLQFYGLMPMTNKATEAEYTCNGTKVSYRIAGPLRCVRN